LEVEKPFIVSIEQEEEKLKMLDPKKNKKNHSRKNI